MKCEIVGEDVKLTPDTKQDREWISKMVCGTPKIDVAVTIVLNKGETNDDGETRSECP